MSPNIRLARPGDIPALIDLAAETFLDSFGDYHTSENCQLFIKASHNAKVYGAAIKSQAEYVLIAEDKSELIAYLYSKPTSLPVPAKLSQAHELSKIYTRRSMQSCGIGERLLKMWEHWAKGENFKDLVLGVWSENEKAQAFYIRHGYSKISSHKLKVGDTEDTDYIFHKTI